MDVRYKRVLKVTLFITEQGEAEDTIALLKMYNLPLPGELLQLAGLPDPSERIGG